MQPERVVGTRPVAGRKQVISCKAGLETEAEGDGGGLGSNEGP